MNAAADAVDREADRLTELDSPIGDADHGTNLRRGFTAVRQGLRDDQPSGPGPVLLLSGRLLVSKVGGASGPLYGTLLRRAGKALGDESAADGRQVAAALRIGVEAVAQLGGAVEGDKTMLDALFPALTALEEALESGEDLADALAAAGRAAAEGAAATVPLRARRGRASYLGERSVGHEDPGAASSVLLVTALAEAVGAGE
ncbi:dihydroxyacetone kinase subunit L [Streptomyces sp. RKND-216]|uniref:dihydroxyacetone kinase subunit DhaL n=1 Tax=Streptomyces sp. RKND-216 TaxID=2562581 RepID=UPI00109DC042|nr:dihydroxyacetone kinase subunit DhaL [Streptomyces sp. RKND-216]THA27433.1 dihydroxyacetone kinase subunit L [Streptomyces sp. RKND-216]